MIVLYRKVIEPVFDRWEYHSASHETVPVFRDAIRTERCVWSNTENDLGRERASAFAARENYKVMVGVNAWDDCLKV